MNISLLSAQTVANFSNFLAVFQYSRIIYTTFDFFFSHYFIILKFDGFLPQMFFSSSIKNSQRNLGTHPMKTLWIYRIRLGRVGVGLILDIKVNSNSL